MTTKEFAKILQDKLTSEYGVDLSVASKQQIYRSLALICRQMMSENHKKFQSKAIGTGTKQVYYLCMEFLMGRSLKMSLFNLGLEDVAQKVLADADINIEGIFEEEPDAGLGNGGLGRLAACYLDGMATTGICGTGYSILYEYGIFKQKIVDGWQQERADNWLPGGQVWLKSHPDQAIEVRFDGEIRGMSPSTRRILASVEYEALRLRRRANYEALHAALAPHNALDCPDGADAMIYPFLCRVDGLRGRLIKNKVYVSQWWKYLLELLPADSVEADYSRYLLPLPIDQRYTPDDMRALAALVLQLKEEGEPA